MAIHLAFKAPLQIDDGLTGSTMQQRQQVGDPWFFGNIEAHDRRLFGVGNGTLDLFGDRLGIFEQSDNVVLVLIRLGHLLRRILQTHDPGTLFWNKWLRHRKEVAVQGVEAVSDVTRQLQMLFLVMTYRDLISLIQQNIGSHQNRITKQSHVDVIFEALRLVLELGHARQFTHLGIAIEDPA